MPEFILDTNGRVARLPKRGQPSSAARIVKWRDLDSFTQGYVEALFFTECEPGTDAESHEPESQSALHGECGFSDLAPEALASIMSDCRKFQDDNAETLARAYDQRIDGRGDDAGPGDYDATKAGRDYWFTRNGHGVGFWDRNLGEAGDLLSGACNDSFVDVYLGDDGRVYV